MSGLNDQTPPTPSPWAAAMLSIAITPVEADRPVPVFVSGGEVRQRDCRIARSLTLTIPLTS